MYASKWWVKKMCNDSKTRKIESCACPEVVVALQKGWSSSSPRVSGHREETQRGWFSSPAVDVCSPSLETPQELQEIQKRSKSPTFVHWESITCDPTPTPGSAFSPLNAQEPLEAAACPAQEDVGAPPLSCKETLPSSPGILLPEHLPYQLFLCKLHNPHQPEQHCKLICFVICGRIIAFQPLPMKGNY